MQDYLLLDGTMLRASLEESVAFSDPCAGWFAPLLPSPPSLSSRLAGPVLVSIAGLAARVPECEKTQIGWLRGFPAGLACSFIQSARTLDQLAAHLSGFVRFADGDGDSYGLRIADCRVLAYLHNVLEAVQWAALMQPITRWEINGRDGRRVALPLPPVDPANADAWKESGTAQLQISADQIGELVEWNEPDALLAAINLSATEVNPKFLLSYYQYAALAIRRWKAGGGGDRGALMAFSRRALGGELGLFNDAEALRKAFGPAAVP